MIKTMESQGLATTTRGDQGHHVGGQPIIAAWTMEHSPRRSNSSFASEYLKNAVSLQLQQGFSTGSAAVRASEYMWARWSGPFDAQGACCTAIGGD